MKTLQPHKANLIGSLIFIIIGVTIFIQMSTLNERGDSSDPGATGYPNLIGGAIIILAVLLAFQRDKDSSSLSKDELLRVIAAIVITVLYIYTMHPLGYVLATVLYLLATMLLMGIRSIIGLILVPTGFTLLNFYLFYEAFGVPLPYTFIERILT